MEVETVVVTATYIYPAQITRPAGPFILSVQNHSTQRGLALHIAPTATKVDAKLFTLDNVNGAFHDVIDLAPGTYDLYETNNTKLHLTITITK